MLKIGDSLFQAHSGSVWMPVTYPFIGNSWIFQHQIWTTPPLAKQLGSVDGRNPAPPLKPCKSWDKLPINWCRISSINSIIGQMSDRYNGYFRPRTWLHSTPLPCIDAYRPLPGLRRRGFGQRKCWTNVCFSDLLVHDDSNVFENGLFSFHMKHQISMSKSVCLETAHFILENS